jgi:hypothetical protein
MCVQLRIIRTARRLPEPGHDQPLRVGVQAAAVGADAGGRAEPFKMRQHSLDGDIVRFREARVTGQRPQHAQRLRGRYGRVETGDGADRLAVGECAVFQRETELDIADRVVPR